VDPEACESSFNNNDNGLQFVTGSIRPNLEYLLWICIIQIRAGQLQPTGGPHKSLRTRLRAARLYTYTEEEARIH